MNTMLQPMHFLDEQLSYIKYKSINATIPDDKDPENITIEEALDFIARRIEYDENKKGKKKKKK